MNANACHLRKATYESTWASGYIFRCSNRIIRYMVSCLSFVTNYGGGKKILLPPHDFARGGSCPPCPPESAAPVHMHSISAQCTHNSYGFIYILQHYYYFLFLQYWQHDLLSSVAQSYDSKFVRVRNHRNYARFASKTSLYTFLSCYSISFFKFTVIDLENLAILVLAMSIAPSLFCTAQVGKFHPKVVVVSVVGALHCQM